jgi:hypothetical protein
METFFILLVHADTSSVLIPIALELMAHFNHLPRVARTAIRYPLETAVAFWWRDENGQNQQFEGRGRDVSDRGVFVFASTCPPVGTGIGLRISLDGLPDLAPALRIDVEGRVLRVEPARSGETSGGFAVMLSNAKVADSGLRKYPVTEAGDQGKGH